jgi:hypothetical protein
VRGPSTGTTTGGSCGHLLLGLAQFHGATTSGEVEGAQSLAQVVDGGGHVDEHEHLGIAAQRVLRTTITKLQINSNSSFVQTAIMTVNAFEGRPPSTHLVVYRFYLNNKLHGHIPAAKTSASSFCTAHG